MSSHKQPPQHTPTDCTHLAELLLHHLHRQLDERGDVGNLNTAEGLNQAHQVLLQQRA